MAGRLKVLVLVVGVMCLTSIAPLFYLHSSCIRSPYSSGLYVAADGIASSPGDEATDGLKLPSSSFLEDKTSKCQCVFNDTDEFKDFRSALQEYKKFHSMGVSQLRTMSANSTTGYSTTSECAQVCTLTWSCEDPKTCAGVGDQLRRIAFTFLLAVASHRVFTVYWNERDYKTMQFLQPNDIDWSYFDEKLGMHKGHDISKNKISKKRDYLELSRLLDSNTPHVTITNEIDVSLRSYLSSFTEHSLKRKFNFLGINKTLFKHNRSSAWIHITGTILRYLFKFPDEVLATLERIEDSLRLRNQTYLAIHIRTGFVGESFEEVSTKRRQLSPLKIFKNESLWEQTLACSLKIANEKIGPTSPIVLATDSEVVKEWALKTHGDRIRSTNATLYHVSLEESWSKVNVRSDFIGLWIDFLLLAKAHILVHGTSGFSSVAGAFYSIPPHRQYTMPHCT